MKRIILLFLLIEFLLLNSVNAQSMNDYCQMPPFITKPVRPNILLVIDVSGSMGWPSYLDAYNPADLYEGYFVPDKFYTRDSNGIWTETSGPENCYWRRRGLNGVCSGNFLNWFYMTRIDLVRWAMTGGQPASCQYSGNTPNPNYCDPELWDQPGNSAPRRIGSYCNDSLDVNGDGIPDGGCILLTYYGEYVKVPWSRVYDGLIFQLKNLSYMPRIGVMFYSGTGVRADKVYIGDFTAPNSTSDQFPYMNLITYINHVDPGGSTPTGPAMWDALNYFAQQDPEYGGFKPQSGEGDRWKNPMYVCEEGGGATCEYVPCAKNFVILLSDGQWNYGGGPPAILTCSIDTGYENHSADPVVPAYHMHMGFTNIATGERTSVSAVYTIGLFLGGTGEQSMKNVAMYGSFDNTSKTWPDNLEGYPWESCWMDDCSIYWNRRNGKGSACTPLPSSSRDWDEDGDGVPDTFQNAWNAIEIRDAIMNALLDIIRRVSAGSAVSILASGEGSGANMLQAVFYPKRTLGNSDLTWTGVMQNLWYYLDPFIMHSHIREDTVADKTLNLKDDYIVMLEFDETENKVVAKRASDDDGNGSPDTTQPTKDFEDLNYLWEAGILLFKRNPDTRIIYTNINDDSALDSFSLTNASNLMDSLNVTDVDEAKWIISYVRGKDVRVCSTTKSIECSSDADCPVGETCLEVRNRTTTLTIDGVEVTNTWKLGDIVYSTPKIQTWVPLNDYYERYNDDTYKSFVKSYDYQNRGMVYVGANDGMLHAFKLGKLTLYNRKGSPVKAKLEGIGLGEEVWAFIPRNALPYLKYLMDTSYCHLYYVDGSVSLFDASIGTTGCSAPNYWECTRTSDTWRTILIGSMRFGGACRQPSSGCTDCVEVPTTDIGYSSYFALDVTDPLNPVLLWEFPDKNFIYKDLIGYSTAVPGIIKIAAQDATGNPDSTKNGRWFVVIPSGPTGPIDTTSHEFLGRSDQDLRIFILDLKTGELLRMINTGITNAFGSSLVNATVDTDTDYQDDVLYIGYTKEDSATSTWTKGGVLRLTTVSPSTNKESINPNDWSLKEVINTGTISIGPITTAIENFMNTRDEELWIFFGTGRYFYKNDDLRGRNKLFGIKDPCYSSAINTIDPSCTTQISTLVDATSTVPSSVPYGWYINLDCAFDDTSCGTDKAPEGYSAERLITDPLFAQGGVFFSTFSPTAEVCGYGGNTYIWAVDYKTGGVAPGTVLKMKILIQLSTGEVKEVLLKEALTEKKPAGASTTGRRTPAFKGLPPLGQGMSILMPAEPLKKILWIKER